MSKYDSSVFVALVMSLLIVGGCVIVRSEGYTYQGSIEVKESSLRLDGYYYEPDSSSRISKGFAIYPFLLWENGIAAFFTEGYGKTLEEKRFETVYGSISEARTVFELRMDSLVTGHRTDPAQWGQFRVNGDSISIQVMVWDGSALHDVYRAIELRGEILNDTTFVLTQTENFTGAYEGKHKMSRKYHFCPLDEGEKPSSDNWTQTHPELQ